MVAKNESLHASVLRALGFEQFEPSQHSDSTEYSFRSISEQEASTMTPSYQQSVELPCYFVVSGATTCATIAVDELGQHWRLRGKMLDMTVHGFGDLFGNRPLQ